MDILQENISRLNQNITLVYNEIQQLRKQLNDVQIRLSNIELNQQEVMQQISNNPIVDTRKSNFEIY